LTRPKVQRVHGDGCDLVWSVALSRLIARMSEAQDQFFGDHAEMNSRTHLYRRNRDALRTQCAAAFADEQGWKPTRARFPFSRLGGTPPLGTVWFPSGEWGDSPFDHAERFVRDRRAVAMVIHLYAALPREPVFDAVTVDRLPASWYWPGHTDAYVLRRGGSPQASEDDRSLSVPDL
jgi:hypothetical protein